jgi:hypothetical protein
MSEHPDDAPNPGEQAEEEGNYEGVSGGEYTGQSGDPDAEQLALGDEEEQG